LKGKKEKGKRALTQFGFVRATAASAGCRRSAIYKDNRSKGRLEKERGEAEVQRAVRLAPLPKERSQRHYRLGFMKTHLPD
jgi:hypothetical protein